VSSDNGSNCYISGAPDARWDNELLHQLNALTGDDFEAVDSSGLMLDPNSGQVRQTGQWKFFLPIIISLSR
jgi:hypothetical protein